MLSLPQDRNLASHVFPPDRELSENKSGCCLRDVFTDHNLASRMAGNQDLLLRDPAEPHWTQDKSPRGQ
ncbi:hypothetical protein ATANTOWER_025808 [Ataeniobius toweri]|uniref:Uncharacterized protein n=1 Tax=Ataeniobius toweri TaxID=208326 RepID=A0ABU7C6Q6_9TELE|nr:hypothetical protein [Ataeniobius toweri]